MAAYAVQVLRVEEPTVIAAERLIPDIITAIAALGGLAFFAYVFAPRVRGLWSSARGAVPAVNRRRAAAVRWLRKYGRLRKAGLPRLRAALAVGDGEPERTVT